MSFLDPKFLKLDEFRPGVLSKIESGESPTMVFMDIAPHQEGRAYEHPFDQSGVVLEGEIEMSIDKG